MLNKMNYVKELFTIECEQQLSALNFNIIKPSKSLKKGVQDNQLYSLFIQIQESEMIEEVAYHSALFVYFQLNTSLMTDYTVSPNV